MYPRADIEIPLYMKMPAGIAVKNDHRSTRVLKLRKNLNDQTQAGRVWFNHLSSKLLSIGFNPSKVDPCIFYRDPCIFFFYVDDGIFMSPKEGDVNKAITDLKATHLDIEDRGDIADYLGVNFYYKKNGKVIMTQPQLINQIITDAELKPNSHLPPTPAVSSRMLKMEESEPEYQGKFHYSNHWYTALTKLLLINQAAFQDFRVWREFDKLVCGQTESRMKQEYE